MIGVALYSGFTVHAAFWLVLALFALSLSALRHASRLWRAVGVALFVAGAASVASAVPVLDRCWSCSQGLMPEWWCWLQFCF